MVTYVTSKPHGKGVTYEFHDGLLNRIFSMESVRNGAVILRQLIVPRSLREELLTACHEQEA